jgi:hypothetical protein
MQGGVILQPEQIAPVVHEAIRAYQKVLGQKPSPAWEDATWEKESTLEGVKFALADPTPGQQHNQWMEERLAAGWTWGPQKDSDAKTNPTLVPFEQLPESEQAKDTLLIAITRALKDV